MSFWAFVMASAFTAAPTAGVEAELAVDRIIQRMEDYEKAIPNCVLKGTYHLYLTNHHDKPGLLIPSKGTFRFVFRRPDAIRLEDFNSGENPRPGLEGQQLERLMICAHRAGKSWILEASGGRFFHAHSFHGNGPFPTAVQPMQLIHLCPHGTASAFIRGLKGLPPSAERVDGTHVAVIRTDWIRNEQNFMFRTEVRVDLSRSCLPLSITSFAQAPGSSTPYDSFAFSVDGLREVQPGIWMATRVSRHIKSLDGRNNVVLSNSAEVNIEEFELEPRLSDSMFELKIPPGVMVQDEINRRSYQSFAVNPEAVKLDSAEIRALRERLDRLEAPPIRKSEEGSRSLLLVGTIGGLALVIGLAVYWAKRRWA